VWVALAVGNGLYFSFSVFLVPLVEEFHWSRGLTAGAQSVSTIVQAFWRRSRGSWSTGSDRGA
jgi:hypothetical protein